MTQKIILVQVGYLGSTVIDHLITPLAKTGGIDKVLLICRHPGPIIPKVEYHCPPKLLARFSLAAGAYEYLNLLRLAIIRKPTYLAGYLLFPHGIMAFLVAKLLRKPVIISLIAGPVELYTMGGSPLGVRYVKPLPWYGAFLLSVLKHSDAIITTGSVTKDFLIKHGIKKTQIYPMINPPNKSRFQPLQMSKIYDVVSVGRLAPVKHNEVMIRAIAKVKEEIPNINFCIVGNGSCELELIQLVEHLGIKENVKFVGFQDKTENYYNNSKIFILASEREGFPNVVLEAMMCGLPCVVSNCGDILNIAKNGNNSLVIDHFDDHLGFARAIINILRDDTLYRQLSQNALRTVESVSEDEVINKWILLMHEINTHD